MPWQFKPAIHKILFGSMVHKERKYDALSDRVVDLYAIPDRVAYANAHTYNANTNASPNYGDSGTYADAYAFDAIPNCDDVGAHACAHASANGFHGLGYTIGCILG